MASLSQLAQPHPGIVDNTPYDPSKVPGTPEFSAAFNQAAQSGYFGAPDPYGLNSLMNSDTYKAYADGNNTQAYDAAYQNAVNASRSNITQALGAAMTELNNRQGAIAAAGAAAPGQIDASYGRANDAINANTGAVQGIMGGAAVNPALGANMAAANAPVLAALAGNQAEAQAGVQPVVSGLGAEISKERAGLQMDAADKLASIDMQAADHQSASAASSNEPSWMQKMLIQNQIDSAQAKSAADVKAQTLADKQHSDLQTLQAKAGNRISPSAGKAYVTNKLSANYVNQVESGGAGRASKAYQAAVNTLQQPFQKKQPKHFKAALAALRHQFPKQHIPISIAMYRLGVTDKILNELG